MWRGMGQHPTSPLHLKGRALGHLLPGWPCIERVMGYCLFLDRPPHRLYLAWIYLIFIWYISGKMKASHIVRYTNSISPLCGISTPVGLSQPPGVPLCSQVSNMTYWTEDRKADKSHSIFLYTRKSSARNVKQNNLANLKETVLEEIDMCALIWILDTVESSVSQLP